MGTNIFKITLPGFGIPCSDSEASAVAPALAQSAHHSSDHSTRSNISVSGDVFGKSIKQKTWTWKDWSLLSIGIAFWLAFVGYIIKSCRQLRLHVRLLVTGGQYDDLHVVIV